MAGAERAIGYVVEKLDRLLGDEIKLLKEVYDNVHWIRSELCWMTAFLEDADKKSKNGDNRTKIWIEDLTNIAHEAEDIVDTFMSQIETKNRQRKGWFKRIVWIPSKLVDLHRIGTEILQIKSKVDDISERKVRYGINNLGELSDPFLIQQRGINPDLPRNKIIVGFGDQKKLILERLLNRKVKKRVVVPIVGIGGLGKTTLAKMIYDSDAINDRFKKCRVWLTVSEDFRLLDLLRKISKQACRSTKGYDSMSIKDLEVQVHDFLTKRRYLIVLDDVWEQHESNLRQQLDSVFPDVKNGSRILITTRSIKIGKSVDPSNEPYELPFLNNRESWQLFLNTVFPSEDDLEPKCPEALETLGKDLVRKCGGLPLGVKILGGLLLLTNPTVEAWKKVALKWKSQDSSLQILALSYNHLPNVNMKLCFLYIGIYPEDHIIKASELTKFWIAEGFIKEEENQTFEETAKDCLDEFVLRCMVQVVDRTRTSKRVKHFRIHDRFREWCISEAQEDGFFRIFTSNTDISCKKIIGARRLTVHNSRLDRKYDDLSHKARAVLDFDYCPQGNFLLYTIGQNFKLLRVIYMAFPKHGQIIMPEQISKLIHLRNLTLKSEDLRYLPSSIGKLHNLQTFNIKDTNILQLPITLHEIPDLRHLYTRRVYITPSATWKSRNLQTLDSIRAGSWMLNDLTKLLNLCKLSICGITQNEVRWLQDSLCKLNHLKSLCLESDGQRDPSFFMSFNHHNPLSKLILKNWSNISCIFPQNLITISLSSCTFAKGVLASLEKLSDLVNLKLDDCGIHSEDEFVFSACGFHQLENLHIDEMRSLLDWKILDGALPNIKCLKIRALDWLAMLPDGLKHLKSLKKLEMYFPKRNLQRRLIGTLEDRKKIPQIPSATLNGIQLDQYNRSSEEEKKEEDKMCELILSPPYRYASDQGRPLSEAGKAPALGPRISRASDSAILPIKTTNEKKDIQSTRPLLFKIATPTAPGDSTATAPASKRFDFGTKTHMTGPACDLPIPPPLVGYAEQGSSWTGPAYNGVRYPLYLQSSEEQGACGGCGFICGFCICNFLGWSSEEEKKEKKEEDKMCELILSPPFRYACDLPIPPPPPPPYGYAEQGSSWAGPAYEGLRYPLYLQSSEEQGTCGGCGYGFCRCNFHEWISEEMSSEEMASEEMSDNEDVPILSSQDVSGGEHASYITGRTKVTVIKKMEAPLHESEYKVILEVMGVNPIGDRPGVDFVTVLLVDSNSLELMKSAMKFFSQKLSSVDRMSIIIMSPSAGPIQLMPLRQITESLLVEVESFGRFLDIATAATSVCWGDLASCIEMGLQVLSDRRFTTGRKAAIMLMSDGIHNFYDCSIPQAQFLNIPVYTFGLCENCDPRVLNQISSLTMGGSFSCIRNSDDLSIAFSQSFADLFGIAARELKLTVKHIESTILTVLAGNCTQSMDDASGIITINFGDLYVNELRKVEVDLRLPTVECHCSNNVLEITSRVADAVVHRSIFIDVARVETSVREDMGDRDEISILRDSYPTISEDKNSGSGEGSKTELRSIDMAFSRSTPSDTVKKVSEGSRRSTAELMAFKFILGFALVSIVVAMFLGKKY